MLTLRDNFMQSNLKQQQSVALRDAAHNDFPSFEMFIVRLLCYKKFWKYYTSKSACLNRRSF